MTSPLSTADRPASSRAFWYVLAIQSQRWKKVIAKLEALEVRTFYPMRTVWRKQRGGPRKRRDVPLIPAYLFVATDLTRRSARSILSIDGVRCFLGVQGVPEACEGDDIEHMLHAQALGDYDETSRIIEQLVVGQVAYVEDGGLAGFNATIVAINGNNVTADVTMFGRSNRVLINVDNFAKSL